MQKYYRETLKLYKDFKGLEARLNKNFDEAKSSHNYSKQYLHNLAAENQTKIDREKKAIERRFSKVREELVNDLESRYDLETNYISPKLINLLNSGISFEPHEYSRLAERHKGNLAESRLLHDSAKKAGFSLENFISFENAMKKFDTHIDRLKKSMWAHKGSLPFYPTVEAAEMGGGQLCAEAMERSFSCYLTPHTLEEHIAHDTQEAFKKDLANADDDAFLLGFTGQKPEEPTPAGMLTEEELADATLRSRLQGRGGEITDDDVSFIRFDEDYQKIIESRASGQVNKTDESEG
jgi:hypothetical protein